MDILDLLYPYEAGLLEIYKRLYFIEAIEEELSKRVEGKFQVRNDIIWRMYQDSFHMPSGCMRKQIKQELVDYRLVVVSFIKCIFSPASSIKPQAFPFIAVSY